LSSSLRACQGMPLDTIWNTSWRALGRHCERCQAATWPRRKSRSPTTGIPTCESSSGSAGRLPANDEALTRRFDHLEARVGRQRPHKRVAPRRRRQHIELGIGSERQRMLVWCDRDRRLFRFAHGDPITDDDATFASVFRMSQATGNTRAARPCKTRSAPFMPSWHISRDAKASLGER